MSCVRCGNPRFLDLFCCQGGATRGYQMAGFGSQLREHVSALSAA